MSSSTFVTTNRLLLKKESLNDFERFFEMSKDPDVMKYIGDGSIFHWTKKVALEKFRGKLEQQKDTLQGNLAVYKKVNPVYIGWCGVGYSKFLDHIELSYRYCRDAWHKGYASEAATGLLDETFKMAGIDKIQACAHPDNIASIRVLEKLGFLYNRPQASRASGLDIPVFQLDRKSFLASL